jgi:hypothetical protein
MGPGNTNLRIGNEVEETNANLELALLNVLYGPRRAFSISDSSLEGSIWPKAL